jgi:hypothetical protein
LRGHYGKARARWEVIWLVRSMHGR